MAIYRNLTRAEYEALPGINWSALKNGIGKTAAHIKAAKAGRKDTPALRFGRLFHLAILEPQKIEKLTVVETKTTSKPDCITMEEWDDIAAMRDGINRLGITEPITQPETALTWKFGGVECKCMFDGIIKPRLIDLKSTQNAEPGAFKGEIFKYKYHGQGAFYLDGCRANGIDLDGFSILAVEKSEPFAAGLYHLDASWLDLGRSCYEEALEVWADNKPGTYGTQIIEPPEWAQPGLVMNESGGIDL